MDAQQGRRVEVVLRQDDMPAPTFANNIQVVSDGVVATFTFYAVTLDRAPASPEDIPERMTGRPVAQIVVPQTCWQEIVDAIFAKQDAARTAGEQGPT